MPEFTVELENEGIKSITVVRGAPCGATWEAASRIVGDSAAMGPNRIGLEIQYCCSANPAGWDVIHGKSPVHFAGNVHQKALERALKKAR